MDLEVVDSGSLNNGSPAGNQRRHTPRAKYLAHPAPVKVADRR